MRYGWLGLMVMLLAACRFGPPELGLQVNTDEAAEGYILYAPTNRTTTYLIDTEGRLINRWESAYLPGRALYMLPNGNILRSAQIPSERFDTGLGRGGLLEEFDWDGNIVWSYEFSNDEHVQHHDFEVLPNGNILILAWQYRSREEALAAGSTGGRGGDLLYRYGNPATYGVDAPLQLFYQHDPDWIPVGRPGEGRVLIFDNGHESLRPYSRVVDTGTADPAGWRILHHRAGDDRVGVYRRLAVGFLFARDFRRSAVAERQHAHHRGRQRAHLPGEPGGGGRVAIHQRRR